MEEHTHCPLPYVYLHGRELCFEFGVGFDDHSKVRRGLCGEVFVFVQTPVRLAAAVFFEGAVYDGGAALRAVAFLVRFLIVHCNALPAVHALRLALWTRKLMRLQRVT